MKPGAILRRRNAAVSTGDPYYSFVTSLLNFGGADGSTTFTDEKGRTWIANGNVQIDTSLGYNACLFDGSGDYLSGDGNAAFFLGTSDFCIERWVKAATSSFSVYNLYDGRPVGTNGAYMALAISPTQIATFVNNANQVIGSHGVTITNMNHFAVIRESGTTRIAVNGTTIGSAADSNVYTAAPADRPTIGVNAANLAADNFAGWMAAHRITVGHHRYGSSFTPDTYPFLTS